ncbi:histone-lysine N-methyltransferase, H3 lysine-9 specific SUVH5-like [Spinacia oleracea]|uniref:Histone-lysine N-methyltransferase, H3 lysine-9 specific SUVH5-like n=1 Tax=Spinacia oleracea TaxID=3562 RepID=A0A9R0IU89_SPIOL|nr:histone-lysine N-methyltransferase, H3 lysine-9 specific SUVH5-like [Spinacia oleracea]
MKTDLDLGCVSLKKRDFTKTSFECPGSHKWRRKVSATKTNPISTSNIKKTNQFPTMKNRGIEKNIASSFKRKMIMLSDNNNLNKTPSKGNEYGRERVRVLTTLSMFRAKCKEISRKHGVNRVDFEAKEELTKQGKIHICSSKIIGSVPGVEVGDRFEYRVELTIVGLHGKTQHGIDFMEFKGKSLVTCVVAKEGYLDNMNDSEVITYSGEGGLVRNKEGVCPKDQKLVRGNLAMKNSMIEKNYVRVVRGFKLGGKFGYERYDQTSYFYDGLYKVLSYEVKKGPCKNLIFEFKLKRCPGQPIVPWYKFKIV